MKGLLPARLQAYLQRVRAGESYIEWGALKMPPRIDTPANRRMLQLADTASGAVFAAFEADPYGFTDQAYVEILKPVIWCRPHRRLWQDGLKVGPWPDANCGPEYPWLDAFCA